MAELNKHTNQTTVYKYDAWGNIAKKWLYSGSSTFTPDSANLIKEYDYVYSSSTDMAWKDLMTKYDGKTITYDEIGNPKSYMGSTMYWEGRTLVEQIKNGTTITYSYDSSDMRTSKTVGGVKHNYYYVQGKLMYEDCPSYKLYYSYDANGFLSGIKRVKSNGSTENYGVHCNIFGDVISIYYEDGMLAATYTYDSWGKLLSVTETFGADVMGDNDIWTQNSIRYRGYVYDEETQLYYLQSRYYDPNTCRFINADDYSVLTASSTALTDKNLFAYCDSNPIVREDTQGEAWETVFDVISLGASVVEVAINPTDLWSWAGLAGDLIDLIPFVTGVGEVTRAVKTINKVSDTVQIAKAVDSTDDAADIIKTLDRSSGFTKSTASAGRKIHNGYKVGDGFNPFWKEFKDIKGIRPDYVDFDNKIIYELKPMNSRSAQRGIRQLQKYNRILGGGFTLRLELYLWISQSAYLA